MNRIKEDHLEICKSVYDNLKEHLDERTKRLILGALAKSLGYGGQQAISALTGVTPKTIKFGMEQLNGEINLDNNRIRRKGGGRSETEKICPHIEEELLKLVTENTKDDPDSPLIFTSKCNKQLAVDLAEKDMYICDKTVSRLLHKHKFIVQSDLKYFSSGIVDPVDRDKQFRHIIKAICFFHMRGYPVISVNIKRMSFINNDNEEECEYKDENLSEVIQEKKCIDNVVKEHDSFRFAVECIRSWWINRGHDTYFSNVKEILIVLEGGYRRDFHKKIWNTELQRLSNEIRMSLSVSHFPHGIVKWQNIEYQLCSPIQLNWGEGKLASFEVVLKMIAPTQKIELNKENVDRDYKPGNDIGVHNKELNYRIMPVL